MKKGVVKPKLINSKEAITRMQAIILIVVVIIVAAAGGYYWYTTLPTEEEEEIPEYVLVGGSYALTGPSAPNGIDMKWGIEYAINKKNDEGGVYFSEYDKKLPIRFISYDDEFDPVKAQSLTERLINIDKVDILSCGGGGPLGPIHANLANKYKVPNITTCVVEDTYTQGYEYHFNVFFTAADHAIAFFGFIEDTRNVPAGAIEKIAVMCCNEPVGIGTMDYMLEMADDKGYDVVYNEIYDITSKDFSAMLLKAKDAEPDAVHFFGFPGDGFLIWKQVKELDFNCDLWWTQMWSEIPEFRDAFEKDAEYCTQMILWHYTYTFGESQTLADDYTVAMGGRECTFLVACAYTRMIIMFDALERAGELDSEKIKDALHETDMDTVLGPHTGFYANGKLKLPAYGIQQWINGTLELVYPYDIRTADYQFPCPPWDARP